MAYSKKDMTSADELVDKIKIPRPFLRKILQILNKNQIIKSYRGKGGGFVLQKNPKNISLIDIIKIFQGEIKLGEHVFKKRKCPNIKTCCLRKKLDGIEQIVIKELKSITIASLLR